MQTFTFTLSLRGASPLDHLNRLFERGCDDAIFGEREDTYFAEFDRTAPSLTAAVSSAIDQIEFAVPGVTAIFVKPARQD